MSRAQRDSIAWPISGLLIYQTNSSPGFYFFDGSEWMAVTPKAGANKSLSNLLAPTAVNADLLPVHDDSMSLGSSTFGWKNVFLDGDIFFDHVKFISHGTSRSNTFLGSEAGISSTGSNNTYAGYQAGYSTTTASDNSFFGSNAGHCNTTGDYNSFYGKDAGFSNTTGSYNSAFGHFGLSRNTTANSNSAFGNSSLYENTEGNNNCAFGRRSLFSNTTGANNVAIGFNALYSNTTSDKYASGSDNKAVGYNALYSNASDRCNCYHSGGSNIAVGSNSMYCNITRTHNVAIGHNALYSSTNRLFLVAVGDSALFNNGIGASGLFEGNWNTAVGHSSLFSNTNGVFNTAYGREALRYNTTGNSNTAVGSYALALCTAGYSNTAVGANSGPFNLSSSYRCSYFGYYAQDGGYEVLSNSMALGYNAYLTESNQVKVGNVSITSIGGFEPWTTFSDGRYKHGIQDNVPGLEFINKLKPITYYLDVVGWRKFLKEDLREESFTNGGEKIPGNEKASSEKGVFEKERILYTGFIAQEVEARAMELGYDFSGVDAPQNEYGLYGLRYSQFVVPLVKAVQELSSMNEELRSEIENLKSLFAARASVTGGFCELKASNSKSEIILGQSVDNPFDDSKLIPFRIPKDCMDALIMITNTSTSQLISVIPISGNESYICVDAGALAIGAYSYALYVGGEVIATKSMVLQCESFAQKQLLKAP